MNRNGPLALGFHTLVVAFMLAPLVVVCLVAFDLDQALAAARQMTGRDDPGAHFGLAAQEALGEKA